MTNLSTLFTQVADWSSEYSTALCILQQSSRGRIWVVGGFVYRTLARELYGTPMPACDFDFMVEEMEPALRLPGGWTETRNSHGNQKIVGPSIIDLIPEKWVHTPQLCCGFRFPFLGVKIPGFR